MKRAVLAVLVFASVFGAPVLQAQSTKALKGYRCVFGDSSGSLVEADILGNSQVHVTLSKAGSILMQHEGYQVDPKQDYFAVDWAEKGVRLVVFKVESGAETLFRGVARLIIALDEKIGKRIYGVFLLSEVQVDASTGKTEEVLLSAPSDLLCTEVK